MYLYFWDNRWAWGLGYPKTEPFFKASSLWLIWAICLTIKHLTVKFGTESDDPSGKTEDGFLAGTDVNDLIELYTVVPILIIQWWRHKKCEDRRVLEFELDETKWDVASYIKRREAIYTYESAIILVVGLSKLTIHHLASLASLFGYHSET